MSESTGILPILKKEKCSITRRFSYRRRRQSYASGTGQTDPRKKRIGLSPEGFALIGQESKFSYENACTQLLSKCQANCMEEWYPFTSIFLPIIGYRSAKQRQCMDRCNQFCKLPSRILSGETSTTPSTPVSFPQ
ncbi:hypothetical protein LEP1GSC151_5272 [Leptospira interrogans serovar Grippotyphosa str. LT2186]|uniref:Uncharacterized protein n=1 Tax=Leptospira interrogans serovar Grippotyphosa str. LT2186 TaxID=1001599 RepID=M3HB77_LEPIR|nr:hypothetical protein LEP1GSC151_5272 [Leptospira interrogans serovar Grippotyphosa str. LT2186]